LTLRGWAVLTRRVLLVAEKNDMIDIYTMLDGTVYFNFMNDSSYVVMKHVNVKREEYTIKRVSLSYVPCSMLNCQ
jgi:hypothetical protein